MPLLCFDWFMADTSGKDFCLLQTLLGVGIIGSSGNEDYSVPNLGPVRILMSIWSLRGLRCNLGYTQPSFCYLLESARNF